VKALAHPGRLRMLAMLRAGDLCVCQLTAVLDLAASTVSSHLGDLRRAGFVQERKSGKWVHYHLVGSGPLADMVRQTLRLVDEDEQLRQDARLVSALRAVPLEALCRADLDLKAVGVIRHAAGGRRRPAGRPSGSARGVR
jgi:DNA-binding transcriptional ArsR family regulator